MTRLLALGLLAVGLICTAPGADLPQAPKPFVLPDPAATAADAKAYYALPKGAVRLGDLDFRHAAAVTVSFSPDGKTILTGGAPGVRVWDAKTHKLLRQYPEESFTGWPLVATPDGRYFVSKATDDVRMFSRTDGKLIHTFGAPGTKVSCFAVSPDGKTVATGSWEGEVLLWEVPSTRPEGVATGKRRDFVVSHPPVQDAPPQGVLPQPPRVPPIMHVGFSPDGSMVASSANGDVVRGWDVKNGKPVWVFDRATTREGPFAFAPDGKRIAVPTYIARQKNLAGFALWTFADGKREVELEDGGHGGGGFGAYTVCFSPDGRYFAAGGGDHKLRVWDTKTGKYKFTAPMPSSVQEVQFSPDGKTLACVSMGVTLWDVETGKELTGTGGHACAIGALAVTADGKTAFTAGGEGSVRAWNTTNGAQKWVLPLTVGGDRPYAIALSPDGKELALACGFGTVRVLDAATGKELRKLPHDSLTSYAIAYAPDGKSLAALGSNLKITVWEVPSARPEGVAGTGKVKGVFVGYDGYGGGGGTVLGFTPDSKTVLATVRRGPGGGGTIGPDGKPVKTKFDPDAGPGSDEDGLVRLVLWDIGTGKRLRVLGKPTEHGHTEAVFDAEGKTLVARDGNDVVVIDFETGKEQRRFEAEYGTLAFASDGKLWSGCVCYDIMTGKKVSEVAGGKYCVIALAKDGRTLVTADGSGNNALVWKLPER